jgi:ABC-type nitrate/sulfonate/bicarbonate transport system substrate-binding protein
VIIFGMLNRRVRLLRLMGAFVVVGILPTAFLSTSCSFKDSSRPLEQVIIGSTGLETSTLIFIAEDQRFFTRNGLNVNNKHYDTGANALTGMLKGEVDIAVPVGEYAMVGGALSKESILTLGSIDRADYQSIIGRKDHGIQVPSDLKGKRIGVILGTQQEFYLWRFLELNGVQAQDAVLVNITLSRAVDAIAGGEIDGVVAPPPYTDSIMAKLGSSAVAWSVQANQLTQQLLVCRNEWVIQYPELAERFIKSLAKAQEYLETHPGKAKAIVQERLNLQGGDVSRIWTQNRFGLSLDQSLIIAMEDEARWMMQNNLTTERKMPDFMNYIYEDALKAVRPEAVNIW